MKPHRIALLFALLLFMSVRSALAEGPSAFAVVLNNRGVKALEKREWTVAIDELSKALLVDPNYHLARENLAIAHSDYGLDVYLRSRNKREASRQFHQSVYICPCPVGLANLRGITILLGNDPNSFTDHRKLADKFSREGDLVSAVVEYRAALKLKNDSQARRKLERVEQLLNQTEAKKCNEFQGHEWSRIATDFTLEPQDYIEAASFLESKGKYPDAAQCLLKCIQLRPDLESAWMQLCRCYMEIRDFDRAEETGMRVQQSFPGSPSTQQYILNLLIVCEAEAGKLERLQESLNLYLRKFPHAEDVNDMRQLMKDCERDLVAMGIYEEQGFEVPMHPLPSMPMSVYIPGKVIASGSKLYNKSVALRFAGLAKKALREWALAANQQLSFVFVDTAADADLQCEWTTDLTKRPDSFTFGKTGGIDTSRSSYSRKVMIFLDSQKVMSDSVFYTGCLHEFGHALGLHHSSRPSDIMYFAPSIVSVQAQQHLSKRDVERIKMYFPDPCLARKAALQFAQSAYVYKDYQTAYELLIPGERWNISLQQFRRQIENEHPGSRPSSIQISQEHVCDKIVEFTLSGTNEKEFFYYDVPVALTESGAYRVLHFRRHAPGSFAQQTAQTIIK